MTLTSGRYIGAMITRARLRHLDLLDYRPRLESGSYGPPLLLR